jgi:uncharacterized protein
LKVVLDTNVVLSGFFFGGVPGRILEAWHAERFTIVVSPSILREYREAGALLEARYGGSLFEAFAAILAVNSEIVDAPDHLGEGVSVDPDDDKFLVCALAAGAQVVVSGDKDLLAVSGWRGVEVLKPRAFVDEFLPDMTDRAR